MRVCAVLEIDVPNTQRDRQHLEVNEKLKTAIERPFLVFHNSQAVFALGKGLDSIHDAHRLMNELHTHTRTCARAHTLLPVCARAYVRMRARACVCVCVCVCVCIKKILACMLFVCARVRAYGACVT